MSVLKINVIGTVVTIVLYFIVFSEEYFINPFFCMKTVIDYSRLGVKFHMITKLMGKIKKFISNHKGIAYHTVIILAF